MRKILVIAYHATLLISFFAFTAESQTGTSQADMEAGVQKFVKDFGAIHHEVAANLRAGQYKNVSDANTYIKTRRKEIEAGLAQSVLGYITPLVDQNGNVANAAALADAYDAIGGAFEKATPVPAPVPTPTPVPPPTPNPTPTPTPGPNPSLAERLSRVADAMDAQSKLISQQTAELKQIAGDLQKMRDLSNMMKEISETIGGKSDPPIKGRKP